MSSQQALRIKGLNLSSKKNQTIFNASSINQDSDLIPVKQSSLVEEYKQRQQIMDQRLKKEIENHQIAKVYVKNQNSDKPITIKNQSKKGTIEQDKDASPLRTNDQYLNLPFEEKPQQFFRSNRSVAMRIKETYDNQLTILESDKMTLIKRLNDALVQLDQLNLEKSGLSNKLIELIKFVRDMQRETHKCDDLTGVVSGDLKMDLKSERELSFQMKEDLKRAEMERLRILSKLNELSLLSDELELDQSDMNVEFLSKSRTYEQVQEDYKDILQRIEHCQNENDHLRAEVIVNKEAIQSLSCKIEGLKGERNNAYDKERYDAAIANFSKERHDIDNMHDRHLRLLSSSLLFNTLNKVLHLNMTYSFQSLGIIARKRQNLIQGLLRMRKLFKMNRKLKLKRSLYQWYNGCLKPLSTIKQQNKCTSILSKRNPIITSFYKWHNLYQRRKSEKHIAHQRLLHMLQSKDNFHLRTAKHYLMKWRDLVKNNEEDRKKPIIKFLLKKHQVYLTQYFNQWKAISLELDFQIQMNGICQRLAKKKEIGSIFSGWRLVSTDLKNKRLSILNRTLKNMKLYVIIRKQLRCQALTVLREGEQRKQNLLKACFDELRVHKEEEKYLKATYELNEVEIPRKQQAIDIIDRVSQDDTLKFKTQGLNAISKCFGKVLNLYFKKWKDATEEKKEILNSQLKQRIIQRYFTILREAFTQWIAYKGLTMTSAQSEVILMQEEFKVQLTNDIVQSQLEISEKQQRQKCQSGKQMKKIIMGAFQRQLRDRFNQWKINQNQRIIKQDQAEKIMVKLDRRTKRLAFNNLKGKINMVKQEILFERRVEDIRFKLRERERQRIFNAIKQFAQNHLSARRYLLRLLTRLDLSLKQTTLRKWHRYRQFKIEKVISQSQNQKVDQLRSLADNVHTLSDQLEESNQGIQKLEKRMSGSAKRIIKIAFERYLQLSLQHSFETWKEKITEMQKRERHMRTAITHMIKNGLNGAFKHWKSSIVIKQQMILEECISSEEQIIEKIQKQKRKNGQDHNDTSQDCTSTLDKVKCEQNNLMIKHGNCLKTLINRVDTKYHVNKLRYIWQNWRQYILQRKKGFEILGKAINKTLWQIGFNQIKDYSKAELEHRVLESNTSTLFKKFYKVRIRQAFILWQKQSKLMINQSQDNVELKIQTLYSQHASVKKTIKERIKDQLNDNRKYLKTFDCFVAWKNHSQQQRLLKTKVSQHREWAKLRNQKSGILKWHSRLVTTNRFRHIKNKVDRVYDRSLISSVFQEWHARKCIEKRFCQTLANLASTVDKVFIKRSFEALKSESNINDFKEAHLKTRGCKFLLDTVQSLYECKMRSTFKQIQIHSCHSYGEFLGQKSVVKYWLTHKIRQYFNQWKEESDRKEVVRYNTEEGKISVEAHVLKKMVYNLKQICENDGIEKSAVDQVVIDNKRNSIKLIEKSVCRLFCYNEDLYLLPQCLDKWKMWVQHRKLYRYWLNYLNRRIDNRTSDLSYAFQKWKYADLQRKQQLEGIQKSQLDKICVLNADKMTEMADQIEYSEDVINNLTDQRDLLLQRYVGSQKLALAATNASCDKAKQRTFSNWISATHDYNASLLEGALKKNLLRIATLKEKIKNYERSNEELAEQNEELREGALDGIEMAKSIDDLTREREKLSIDLADKAITIRKLLEDNHNLSVRLNNAQEEAHNLIKVSQLKLYSSERGLEASFNNY